jgi:hypothetical protein
MTRLQRWTADRLVLQPAARAGTRWARWLTTLLLGLLAGAALGYAAARHSPWAASALESAASRQRELQQQIDKARMAAQVSSARMAALEQQIDQLSRQATECQEQLAFFRKAQPAKTH